jgi:hypothetical protein
MRLIADAAEKAADAGEWKTKKHISRLTHSYRDEPPVPGKGTRRAADVRLTTYPTGHSTMARHGVDLNNPCSWLGLRLGAVRIPPAGRVARDTLPRASLADSASGPAGKQVDDQVSPSPS